MMPDRPREHYWTALGRTLVFLLASTSIACLLLDFYGVCPMRRFTLWVFLPAVAGLFGWALRDKTLGDGELWRAVWIGVLGGLLAAIAYDLFRLPFVFARQWGIDAIFPALNLFKVFPQFGAKILGGPIDQGSDSLAAQLIGWAYHLSNGASFGVMYLALVGNPTRRHWSWAVAFALALEIGMLLTPYSAVFAIPLTARFVIVTVLAHALFGAVLGRTARAFGVAAGRMSAAT